MSSNTLPALQHGGNGDKVQTPNWEEIARRELSLRLDQQGEELHEAFSAAARFDANSPLTDDNLERLRAQLRHKRTFVERTLARRAEDAAESAVPRLRALEWETLQFYQLVANDLRHGGLDDEMIEERLAALDHFGEELGEILREAADE